MADSWFKQRVESALLWITANPVRLVGGVLAGGGVVLLFLFLLFYLLSGKAINPYYGALGFLVLPLFVVFGVFLIGISKFVARDRVVLFPAGMPQLRVESERRVLLVFGIAVTAFVVFVVAGGVQASRFMDSANFCGGTCHSVMEPEDVAHRNSPHATVDCVHCHVGEGVHGLLKSKMRGSWRAASLLFHLYERPIPAPVQDLPLPEDTCMACHNTDLEKPKKMDLYTTFQDDEGSTKMVSAVIMNLGSSKPENAYGIHAHSSRDLQVRYFATDPKRQKIVWVQALTPKGTHTWKMEGEREPDIKETRETSRGRPVYILRGAGEMRTMDCVDCHNRTGHDFLAADRLADELLDKGVVKQGLPNAKLVLSKALEAASRGSKEGMAERVTAELGYAWSGENVDLEQMAKTVALEAGKNLFPQMNVGWGTYPNELRHGRDEGCFRCHNQRMKDETGTNLDQDCDACHEMVADHIPYSEWEERLNPSPKPIEEENSY